MTGNSILLDTNAFIYFFDGREKIRTVVLRAEEIFYSPITEIELLSSGRLTNKQTEQIKKFLEQCREIPKERAIIDTTISLRRKYSLKVPDALICASAINREAKLVSADAQLNKIEELDLLSDIL